MLVAGLLLASGPLAASCAGATATSGRTLLRLGYFPNVTHATALVGVQQGIFADALGSDAELRTQTFNAGPDAVQALFSSAIDAAYVGPNPAINAYAKSRGSAIRIISGATSGGAALVVRDSIRSVDDLRGTTLATPQLGNTQDVALRYWLKQHGLSAETSGAGDVSIRPEDNATTVQAFATGQVDGAWLPEPYASKLVTEGGHVLVDEASLWPGGRFVTTQLVVRTSYLQQHPEVVADLLRGQVRANSFVNSHPRKAEELTNEALRAITGKTLDAALIHRAFAHLTFTNDPIASSLAADARHAEAVGLLAPVDLAGIYDLGPLNRVLAGAGEPEVRS